MEHLTKPSSSTGISTPATDRITYGAVHLDVVGLRRSLEFWRDVIGLQTGTADGDGVALGVDGRTLVVLHPGAERGVGRADAGLYHLAIHLPDSGEFARVLRRLIVGRVPQSPTDHIFSEATYLHDPDGIMLELTLETPERFQSIEIRPDEVVMFDSDGRRRRPTEALDVEAALAHLGDRDPFAPLSDGAFIGHVHLHVPDLSAAVGFYRDVIGFTEHAYMGPFGMADLSAGGRFPHRIAMNNWHGPHARLPRPGTAGMRSFELIVDEPGADEALSARIAAAGADSQRDARGALALTDPAGNRIAVSAAVVASGS
jgi:catechol 2,3-dioxygenase